MKDIFFRIDPLTSIARFYDHEIDVDQPLHLFNDHYIKSLVLSFIDNGEVRINNAIRLPSIAELLALANELRKLGYHKITWKHDGKEQEFNLIRNRSS